MAQHMTTARVQRTFCACCTPITSPTALQSLIVVRVSAGLGRREQIWLVNSHGSALCTMRCTSAPVLTHTREPDHRV